MWVDRDELKRFRGSNIELVIKGYILNLISEYTDMLLASRNEVDMAYARGGLMALISLMNLDFLDRVVLDFDNERRKSLDIAIIRDLVNRLNNVIEEE